LTSLPIEFIVTGCQGK